MAATGGWLPAVVPAVRSPSRGAAESGNAAASGSFLKVPWTGRGCILSKDEALQTVARSATGIQCSTADRAVEIAHEVGKKRGRGRPRKQKVSEEQKGDTSQLLESTQDVSTCTADVTKDGKDIKEKVVVSDRVEVENLVAGVQKVNPVTEEEARPVSEDAADARQGEDGVSGDTARQSEAKESDRIYKESNGAKYDELRARIEKEVERVRGDDDADYPLFVDEEDPTWPEEADSGWGFRLSEIFDEKKVKVTRDETDEDKNDGQDSDDDDLDLNWNQDYGQGVITDITSNEWTTTIFANMSPVVVFVYERYGPSGQLGWKMLKEVENMIAEIWKRVPVRAVKVDAGVEIDLAAAIKVEKTPVVLLVKSGKILHHIEGFTPCDELCQMAAHFFYGAKRPSCLNKGASSAQTTKRP